MKPSKAKQIIENDEEMDLLQMAEAVLELERRKPKRKKKDPNIGWLKKQAIEKEENLRRWKVAQVWNKYKNP